MRTAHTSRGAALTDLILEIFRTNGRLLAAGDRLAEPAGLTSARWQVLGAIALAASPQPVATLARTMGLTRQAVQRIVNELESEGFVAFGDNPHHRRAKLVELTKKGRASYDAVSRLQAPWVNELAHELTATDLTTATRVLSIITERLDRT